MISSVLADAAADGRLTPQEFRGLAALSRRLDFSTYRQVKISVLGEHATCSRPTAFKLLRKLERIGYLEGRGRKPREYRLAVPASLSSATSQAA